MHHKVYIIILNYNGWKDTVECLESVFRVAYPDYKVIVVDNDSTDNSLEYIKAWADGDECVWRRPDNSFEDLFETPLKKPIAYNVIYNQGREYSAGVYDQAETALTVIQAGKNLGFAGGNNVGIRYAIKANDYGFIWLLNNDTVIDKYSLKELCDYHRQYPDTGIIGSKLLYYDNPSIIQSIGGRLNKWFATTSNFGGGQVDNGQLDKYVEIDHIRGASFFISGKCIETVGLLPEDYFMYMEETDYCYKARLRGLEVGYAYKSRVYHKEGSSTGCKYSKGNEGKSYIADILSLRNRLRFAKKYLRSYLPTVYLGLIISFSIRIKRRQWKNASYIIKLILGAEG
ncbi:MAG: glycosyltransferase family 2 protein [Thermodesulfobacteriota bacterium]|nr:glycosyltransferase family 2 protein [Thermodesulfobacteriota bacterium]